MMKSFLILGVMLLLVVTNQARSQERIGFVDQTAAIKDAADLIKAEAELKKIVQSWRDTLGMLQKVYDGKYAAFKKDSASLSADSLRKRATELVNIQMQSKQYERMKVNNTTGGDYIAQRNRLLEPLIKHFREVVAEVAKKEHLSVVMTKDKLVVAPDAIDITAQVAAKLK